MQIINLAKIKHTLSDHLQFSTIMNEIIGARITFCCMQFSFNVKKRNKCRVISNASISNCEYLFEDYVYATCELNLYFHI
jgi:hypothetical protein